MVCLFFIFFGLFQLHGQRTEIELSSSRNSDNSVDIKFTGQFKGHFYLKLIFKELDNASYSYFGHVIYGTNGMVTKLRPIMNIRPVQFRYNYLLWRGKPIRKYDSKQPYLLPYGEGKKVRVQFLNHINDVLGLPVSKSWISYGFNSESPDSVYSCRKGVVVDVLNQYISDTTKYYGYQSKRNYIMVEHEDGTLAMYSGFENDRIHVKPGDEVFPGSYLGIVGRYDKDAKKYLLTFTCYYLDLSEKLNVPGTDGSYGIKYSGISPLFYNDGSLMNLVNNDMYTVTHHSDVITSEMTKKEIKAYQAKIK